MANIVLATSTGKYVGKKAEWVERKGKKFVLLEDTKTSAVTYRVMFQGETEAVHVQFENIEWIDKKIKFI